MGELTKPIDMPFRMIVTSADIELITGYKKRTCRNMIQCVREAYGKSKHQFITILEFCTHYGFSIAEVMAKINPR